MLDLPGAMGRQRRLRASVRRSGANSWLARCRRGTQRFRTPPVLVLVDLTACQTLTEDLVRRALSRTDATLKRSKVQE